jgi:hypothetical protein
MHPRARIDRPQVQESLRGCEFVLAGGTALCRGGPIAEYTRLREIERKSGSSAIHARPFRNGGRRSRFPGVLVRPWL